MKRIIATFILTVSFFHAKGQVLEVPELMKFVVTKWHATPQERAYCQPFYYSIVIDTDEQGSIQSWRYNNAIPVEFKKDFEFLKTFKFPEKYRLKNSTILFYITVDQTLVCPEATLHPHRATELMTEVLNNMAAQLAKHPNTRIIYRPFVTRFFKQIR